MLSRSTTLAAFVAVLAVVSVGPAAADTINIPSEEPTIQAGVLVASAGDTLLLAPMTYTGSGNRDIDFGGIDLVVISEAGAAATIVDCENAARAFLFQSGETGDATIDGLTITRGLVVEANGGAIYCAGSSPTIRNCIFVLNSVDAADDLFWGGGAIFCTDSSAFISGCEFQQNNAAGSFASGGAIYVRDASPTIADCSFAQNYCQFRAAGLHIWGASTPVIVGCDFVDNVGDAWGGAISTMDGPNPVVTNCTFTANEAGSGAGIYSAYSSPEVSDCVFTDNHATSGGGAIQASDTSSPVFTRILCVGNRADDSGGAFGFAWNTPTVTSCTLSGNSAPNGGGVRCYGSSCTPSIQNTIIAFSTEGAAMLCENSAAPTTNHSCIYGNAGGDVLCGVIQDNIFADPQFCEPSQGDFQIMDNSPCSPSGNVWGELVGAYGIGCSGPVPVTLTTWGVLKSLFR